MEEKYIQITTELKVHKLPLRVVAKNRADYYEKKDPGCYHEDFDFVMKDDYEGIDWIKNNMDYDEYKADMVEIGKIEIAEDFNNAEMEII